MMKYLFPNFLKDLSEFYESQNYWIQLCHDVLESNRQLNNWEFGGEPLQHDLSVFESYPIVGGFNSDKSKGFSIDQSPPQNAEKDTNLDMVAYTKHSESFSESQPIIFLVFGCILSNESSAIFKKLLKKWIQPDCDEQTIREYIKFLRINEPN